MSDLSSIYAEYLASKQEPFDRKENRLYVTDVGACPRSVAYRLLQTPKNFRSEQTVINTEMMFDLALYIEATLIDALRSKGMLISEQGPVPFSDRENWGGRYDILADYHGRRIIEVKTVRSNAFNYSDGLPKENHSFQAVIYDHYLKEEEGLEAVPMLWYADRGGANTPLEFEVCRDVWDEAKRRMDSLDDMRAALPSMPHRLPKELNIRSYGKEVKEEPDYRCKYCDYSDTCEPDMGTKSIARLKDGIWSVGRGKLDYLPQLLELGISVTRG